MIEEEDEQPHVYTIPLTVQRLLWSQISPFVQQKPKKLQEASCVTLEHFVADKTIAGHSSLEKALLSTTRRQRIDACLPHVMHCAALLLTSRENLGEGQEEFSDNAKKLLRTLHWIFLESSQVCSETDGKSSCNVSFENLKLFVYLFAPICEKIKESDFSDILTNCQDIWRPIQAFRQPSMPPFNTVVKFPVMKTNGGDCKPNWASVQSTVCDVAVISCLLYHRWSDKGIYWGLNYILGKLRSPIECDPRVNRVSRWKSCSAISTSTTKQKKRTNTLSQQRDSSKHNEIDNEEEVVESFLSQNEYLNQTDYPNKKNDLKKMTLIDKFQQQPTLSKRFNSFERKKIKSRTFSSKIKMPIKLSTPHTTSKKNFWTKTDRPPSYNAAVFGEYSKTIEEQKPFLESHKISNFTYTESQNKLSWAPPPQYSSSDSDSEQQVQKKLCCNSDDLTVEETCSAKSEIHSAPVFEEGFSNDEFPDTSLLENRPWSSESFLPTEILQPEHDIALTSLLQCIDEDGCLKLSVVLSVVDSAVNKNYLEIKTLRVCVDILNCLHDKEAYAKGEDETIRILLRILHNLSSLLGCKVCNETNDEEDEIRTKVQDLITSVSSTHRDLFHDYLKDVIQTQPVEEVVEFLHVLLEFCSVSLIANRVEEISCEQLCNDAISSNDFVNVVVKMTFREMINKCLQQETQELFKKNTEVYNKVKNLIQFVRFNCPSSFNRVLLSVMLIPEQKRQKSKVKKIMKQKETEEHNVQATGYDLPDSPQLSTKFSSNETIEKNNVKHVPKKTGLQLMESSGIDEQTQNKRFISKIFKKMNRKNKEDKSGCMGIASSIRTLQVAARIIFPSVQESSCKDTEFYVEKEDICNGIKILQFLMESSPPGTVPNATVLGSVIGLQSPMISRAAVLLQCAQYVQKINDQRKKQLKDDSTNYSEICVLFHKWGKEVGNYLENVVLLHNDPETVLGEIRTNGDQQRNREEDLNEDYLKDTNSSKSGKNCSIAVQMAACNLLWQITTFLREEPSDFLRKASILSFDREEADECSANKYLATGNLPEYKKDISWLKTMVELVNQQNFLCDHMYFCHPFCHQRINRSCSRLVDTLSNILITSEKKLPRDDKYKSLTISSSIHLLRYLKTKASCLTKSPFDVLLKSATLIPLIWLSNLRALCWEVLLHDCKPLVESAASLFLLCAIKTPTEVHNSILFELNNNDPLRRIQALKKIRILWKYRNVVWKNLEAKAKDELKIQTTTTGFTMSLSSLGLDDYNLPHPPWVPQIINVDEIVAQRGFSKSAAILATHTLSHYKEQELKQIMKEEENERANARKNFRFTTIPTIPHIAQQLRNDTETKDNRSIDHSAPVFPQSISECVPVVIQSILDMATIKSGQSVGEVAKFVVKSCLEEDANLFLRTITEKLIKNEDFLALRVLRKLPLCLDLIPCVARNLFNHVLEMLIYHNNRSLKMRELISPPSLLALSCFIPLVKGIDMQTLKQGLQKQQIDTQLLITAGTQGTKRLSLWNQYEDFKSDDELPQIRVNDESNFDVVRQEAISLIPQIPKAERNLYQLVDKQTEKILCPHCYVRECYTFRKAVYPQVALVKLDPKESEERMTKQVILLKLAEIGRLQMAIEILLGQRNEVDKEINAAFIRDEFRRLWSFPRKAMDAEFFLFNSKNGKEIKKLDAIQKYYWIDLISATLLSHSSEFPWNNDLVFFMNVWSGTLVVHCEQAPLLRRFSAAVIDVMAHFKHNFVLHGYRLVLPPMLQIYSKYYHNKIIRDCLELVFYQMLVVHRKPFLLQLFANAASLLLEYNSCGKIENNHADENLSLANFFNLLLSLTKSSKQDSLQVMSLVKADKPLKPEDQSLESKEPSATFSDYFRLCVTVIGYQPENSRTLEMLVTMNSILPYYFEYMEKYQNPTKEANEIMELAVCVRNLLLCTEGMKGTINLSAGSQQQPSQKSYSLLSSIGTRPLSFKYSTPNKRPSECTLEEGRENEETSEKQQTTEEHIASPDIILHLSTMFYTKAKQRISAISRSRSEDLFDTKSHIRLADIAHCLLKLLTDDFLPGISTGLAVYIKHMLPIVNWSNEAIRPALFIVLKRIDRYFGKICKVYSFHSSASRRVVDIRTVSMMMAGLCDLLAKQPVVSHIPHLKMFVSMSVSAQVGTGISSFSSDFSIRSSTNYHSNLSPTLTPYVMKLIALQIQASGGNLTLEDIITPMVGTDKLESVFLNVVIPLCLCTAAEIPLELQIDTERKKCKLAMALSHSDLTYLLRFCIDFVSKPPPNKVGPPQLFRIIPMTVGKSPLIAVRYKIFIFVIKIILACFHKRIHQNWTKLADSLINMILLSNDPASWNLAIFLMRYKTPLLLHLKSYAVHKLMKGNMETTDENDPKQTLENILTIGTHQPIRLSVLISDFVHETKELRELLQAAHDESASSISNHSMSKSPNASSIRSEKERSRRLSFRDSVIPNDTSAESIARIPEEYFRTTRRKSRASLSLGKSSYQKRNRCSESSILSKQHEEASANISSSRTKTRRITTAGIPKEISTFGKDSAIPNITIHLSETPRTSPYLRNPKRMNKNTLSPLHAALSVRVPRQTFRSESQEKQRRSTIAKSSGLRSKSTSHLQSKNAQPTEGDQESTSSGCRRFYQTSSLTEVNEKDKEMTFDDAKQAINDMITTTIQ